MNRTADRLARALWASRAVFLVNGACIGSWAAFVPIVQEHLGVSVGVLGAGLLMMSLGAMVSMPLAGHLCSRLGSGAVLRVVTPLFAASLLLPVLVPQFWMFLMALCIFGALNGAMDVGMNAQGILVECRLRRPVMSGIHACFSLGALAGAGSAGGLLHLLSPRSAILLLSGVLVVTGLAIVRHVLPDVAAAERRAGFAWPDRPVLVLGLLAFLLLMAEGSMIDWSAALLREAYGASPAVAAVGYAAFSAAMAGGRLSGDWLLARFPRRGVFTVSAALGALGLSLGLASSSLVGILLGIAVLGLGLANLVPIAFSAAASDSVDAGPSVAVVATLGYTGFLLGPPIIGGLAEATNLLVGIGVVGVVALTAGIGGLFSARIRARSLGDEVA
jgi:MFS family permease